MIYKSEYSKGLTIGKVETVDIGVDCDTVWITIHREATGDGHDYPTDNRYFYSHSNDAGPRLLRRGRLMQDILLRNSN